MPSPPTTTSSDGGKPTTQKRRRATRACLSCRARKIRCDAIQKHPNSCTNCQFERSKCVIQRKQPSFSSPTGSRPSSGLFGSLWQSMPEISISNQDGMELNESVIGPMAATSGPVTTAKSPSYDASQIDPSNFLTDCGPIEDLDFLHDSENLTPTSPLNLSAWLSENGFVNDMSSQIHDQDLLIAGHPHVSEPEVPGGSRPPENVPTLDGNCSCVPPCGSSLAWVAPWCTQSLDASIQSTLETVGALHIPPSELILTLFECYFVYMNTFTPYVSEGDTCRLFRDDRANTARPKPMSLALLNAILFAGSGFAPTEQMQTFGFSGVRQMRSTFYRRAKVLYEAGCETDSMNRLRICLLLSNYRSYPREYDEPTSWLLEAHNILVQASVNRNATRASMGEDDRRWKMLNSCYILRACTVVIGSRTIVPGLQLPTVPPKLHLDDLADLNCTWFLDQSTKHKVAALCLSLHSLASVILPLAHLLVSRDLKILSSPDEAGDTNNKYNIGELEELDSLLAEWHRDNRDLFEDKAWPASSELGDVCVFVLQSSVGLGYKYLLSALHQLHLMSRRTHTSSWASSMLETSRKVLADSSSTMVSIFKNLSHRGVIRLVSDSLISHVMIPMVVNTISLRLCSRSTVTTINNLSTCYEVLKVFAERYEIVEYYIRANEICAALAHEQVLQDQIAYIPDWSLLQRAPDNNANTDLLPPTAIYSSALRAIERCFVRGIPDPSKLVSSAPTMSS